MDITASEGRNTFDENGWGRIHYAAYHGQHRILQAIVAKNPKLVDVQTEDETNCTPLMLAVAAGHVKAVDKLIKMGADVSHCDSDNNTSIEIAILMEHLEVVRYFLKAPKLYIPVDIWKILVNLLLERGTRDNRYSKSSYASAKVLAQLSKDQTYDKNLHDSGIFAATAEYFTETSASPDKQVDLQLLQLLHNFIYRNSLDIESNITLIHIMCHKLDTDETTSMAILHIFSKLIDNRYFITLADKYNGLNKVVRILEKKENTQLELICLKFLANCVMTHQWLQAALEIDTSIIMTCILYIQSERSTTLTGLALKLIILLIQNNELNQEIFVVTDGLTPVVELLERKSAQVNQSLCIDLIEKLCDNNLKNQTNILKSEVLSVLTKHLLNNKVQTLTSSIANVLWGLVGKFDERRSLLAKQVTITGAMYLIQAPNTDVLKHIGSQVLYYFANNTAIYKNEILKQNGIQCSMRLLSLQKISSRLKITLLQTIKHMCLDVGLAPNKSIQDTLRTEGHLATLIEVYKHSNSELELAHAANTICAAIMENRESFATVTYLNLLLIKDILELFTSEDAEARLLAGSSAILLKSHNSKINSFLKEKLALSYRNFTPYLALKNSVQCSTAAFQLVVLKNFIKDQPKSISAATGISLLLDNVSSKNIEVSSVSTEYIAFLARTKSGIPEAMLAVGVVQLLSKLLCDRNELPKAPAAVSLAHLSHKPKGEFQFLLECRKNLDLVGIVRKYTNKVAVSKSFWSRWQHLDELLSYLTR